MLQSAAYTVREDMLILILWDYFSLPPPQMIIYNYGLFHKKRNGLQQASRIPGKMHIQYSWFSGKVPLP